jgi:hypothetical protein
MYDKAAEQRNRMNSTAVGFSLDKQKALEEQWTRVELEAKGVRAEQLSKAICEPGAVPGAVVAGVLRQYMDFKERGSGDLAHRYRWSTCAWWTAFLGVVEKVRLAVTGKPKTVEQVYDWLHHQVAPNLAVVVHGLGAAGRQALEDLLESGRERWKKKHRETVSLTVKRYKVLPVPVSGLSTGF